MNANHSAALLAASLVLIMYMVSSCVQNIKYMILLLSLSSIVIFLLMGTQSRSAYVALVIPFSTLIYFSFKNSKVSFIFSILITTLVIGSSLYSSLPRFSSEAEAFKNKYEHNVDISNPPSDKGVENSKKQDNLRNNIIDILNDKSENIPYTSVGLRIHFWVDTVKQFLFNPIFGLGNNANKYILEHSNHSDFYKKKNFQHLHNSYMEVIASNGLIGIALLGYLYFFVFNTAKKYGGKDILVLAICLYSFLAVINLFESYIFVKSGVLIHTLALGILYSYKFKGDVENE
jgi:hypothetical protein